ncbi:ABC transporter ATP-binding protein [Metabacillus idriensis]|uniref:ABC transporter ATP-binding protein n=1 Tax=Metabacillus idriensis TaxID=324768 RepID=UPI002813FEE2|nr:ABC transporter ATP-binding protein [Metabacillus idriensis]MDR0139315.1 ABC transporter ATP-binding protein [Metabacillus idriensis]
MKKVELKNVSKSYDTKNNVIKDINVVIEPGEFFVLVGPSGCGKSTMLRMIAGLEELSGGDLVIGGKKANSLPPSKRDLSMVFQNYALYPHLSVEENITFGLHTKKIKKAEQKQRCEEAAEMLGLSELLKRKPRQLSGGQRQRVALARAIVTHAPICLMDEPLSNLDAKLRAKMRSEIRQIQRKLGITMIYVTHDQTEAMTMADRMMILNNGDIQQIGKPLEIYNQPENTFVASFIGAPPMNLKTAKISSGSIQIDGQKTIPFKGNVFPDRMEAVIGIRPESIQPAAYGKATMTAEVANVEILGTETLISFYIEENEQWLAKWNGQWDVKVGDQAEFYIDERDLFLFDHQSGDCIYSQPKQSGRVLKQQEASV